ncbi:MAG: hypothetical protein ABW219_12835 [Ilumatobacteraceae bacterium]
MAEPWTDDRLDDALRSLADELDVPRLDDVVLTRPTPWRRRTWLAAAAVVAVVAAGVVVVAPARETVARWFGVRIEHDDGASATGSFADDVTALDLEAAIDSAGLEPGSFDATPLGPPSSAGTPPEGGVLLAWPEGETTLWVRAGDDDVIVVKRLIGSSRAELIPDVADYAVLVDGAHVLDTPSRRVAAGRVLWWLADGRQWRLESNLDRSTMIAIAQALALS